MLVSSKMCMTKDVGTNGNMFGGIMLAFMDESAAIYAHNMTGEKRMVTKLFREIVFEKPVKVGDIIEFSCDNIEKGNTSIDFSIWAAVDGEIVFETSCVFVAVDENGIRKPITKETENGEDQSQKE